MVNKLCPFVNLIIKIIVGNQKLRYKRIHLGMSKPTKKQLEQQINEEKLTNNKLVYYTFLIKQGNKTSSSTFGNHVYLVFFPSDNALFYAREEDNKTIPFVQESNIHKKKDRDTVDVMRCVATNPAGTAELHLKYQKKDSSGKDVTQEWKFEFVNKGVAQQWAEMLTKHKTKGQNPGPYSNVIASNAGKQPTGNTLNIQPIKQEDPFFILTESKILNKDEPKNIQGSQVSPVNNSAIQGTNLPANTLIKQPSIVNPPNNGSKLKPSISIDESRLQDAYGFINTSLKESRIKPQNESTVSNDWNFRFVKDPTRETVYEFEKAAWSAFQSTFNQSKGLKESVVSADVGNLSVQIVDCITKESKKLKNEYRNYHYILECCKGQGILSVPMACLIEHLGFVCLVKAKFPRDIQKLKNKRDAQQVIAQLQHRTKISNSVLFNGRCSFYDLTKPYGSYGEGSRIYVDDLEQYMPQFNMKQKDQDGIGTFYARPNLMQYFQNRVIPGGNIEAQKNPKLQNQFSNALQSQIRDIAECLSSEETYIVNIFDLKQFLHFRGVNMKFLYKIYQETKNKFVKKYLQTCLVAKLIKDQIYININGLMKEAKNPRVQEVVEDQIRYFLEGKSATTNEYWKRLSLQYRNLYGSSMNTHELIGGFLLSCLIVLIRGDYDLSRIDKSKTIFKDQGIIKPGFVRSMAPKIKSYYRFSPKIVQTVEICKYSEQNEEIFKRLVGYMNLNSRTVPESYNVNNSRPYILGYLSDFVPPSEVGQSSLPCSKQIYQMVNNEPPSVPTLKITLNYYTSLLKYLKQGKNRTSQEFEAKIHDSIEIINYWLEPEHPKVCDFYEKASNYEQLCGNTDESLQILEKAIEIAHKTQGKNTKKIGLRHYVAGCQYLKSGKKKEAVDNLQKAKACLEKVQGQERQHAFTLLKLSSLQLNNGDTDSCIKFSKEALKNAQKGKMDDAYTIKIYEILCRAYQIKGQKEELRKLSNLCSKQFNKTEDKTAFNQMVKICLTGTIARLSIERSKSLLTLARQLKEENAVKDQNQSINALMEKAKSFYVMENFMMKAENSQKYLNQYTAKKQLSVDAAEFISILTLVSGVVGIDFIEGLHDQKEYE